MEKTKIRKKLKIDIDGKIYDVKVSVKSKTPRSTSMSVAVEQKTYEINVVEPEVRLAPRKPKERTQTGRLPPKSAGARLALEPQVNVPKDLTADLSSKVLIRSPMPAKVLSVNVKVGDKVKEGDVLLVLESMKMENEIYAPKDGKILDVRVSIGLNVNMEDLLLIIS